MCKFHLNITFLNKIYTKQNSHKKCHHKIKLQIPDAPIPNNKKNWFCVTGSILHCKITHRRHLHKDKLAKHCSPDLYSKQVCLSSGQNAAAFAPIQDYCGVQTIRQIVKQ